jgi:PadR family transcriptional regulator PadR
LNPQPAIGLPESLDLLSLKSLVPCRDVRFGNLTQNPADQRGTFVVMPGSLFPTLQPTEEEGGTSRSCGDSEDNRLAKYDRLSNPGPN